MGWILITGATGFIGSHVTELFCEKGANIRCLVRKSSNIQHIRNLPVEIYYGDITKLNEINESLNNVEVIIHIAGTSKDWGIYNDFYKVNVVGTMNVLKAGYDAGINHIIITGSISSYGEEDCRTVKNEDSRYNSHYPYFLDRIFPSRMNYYRDTKALSTQEAVKFADERKMNLTVLEPAWVYGEREFNTGFYEYIKTVKSGLPFLPGSSRNKFHVIYAKDLAQAYYKAYQNKPEGVQRIIIGDKHPEKMEKIYSLFCKELGMKKPVNIPKWMSYPIGFILELLYTMFGSEKPPLLTRSRINMFYDNIEYSILKAEKLLSFTSQYTLEKGIQNTVQWYKQNNLI